jgi:cell division protein ZapE
MTKKKMHPLVATYQDWINQGRLQAHPAQAQAVAVMAQYYDTMLAYATTPSLLKAWQRHAPPQGLYLYGEVGQGKSMLMRLFYDQLPIKQKRWVHYHDLMQEVHASLHLLRLQRKDNKNTGQAIERIASKMRTHTQILCLDELHINDVGDAMIISMLLDAMIHAGIVIIATSNRRLLELFTDGMYLPNFATQLKRFQTAMLELRLDVGQDYRRSKQQGETQRYRTPITPENIEWLEAKFTLLTHAQPPRPVTLLVYGREWKIDIAAGGVAWMPFAELCETALGPQDYISFCEHFHTVCIPSIPVLGRHQRNEAKRFVTLIDQLYSHHCQLYCTAAVSPTELYTEGDGSFEFQRTVSRLIEMQSNEWNA